MPRWAHGAALLMLLLAGAVRLAADVSTGVIESAAVQELPGSPLRIFSKNLPLRQMRAPDRPRHRRRNAASDVPWHMEASVDQGDADNRRKAEKLAAKMFLVKVDSRTRLREMRAFVTGVLEAENVQYVPDDALLVDLFPSDAAELAGREGVLVFELPAQLKQPQGKTWTVLGNEDAIRRHRSSSQMRTVGEGLVWAGGFVELQVDLSRANFASGNGEDRQLLEWLRGLEAAGLADHLWTRTKGAGRLSALARSARRATIQVQPEGAEAVVAWLADRDEVAWVEPRMPPRLRNRGAVPLVLGEALPGATTRAGGSAWEHGLRGEGEIIAIGDTGLDHDSCYFRDDARPVKTCFGGNLSCTGDYLHRKVVAYNYVGRPADFGAPDEVEGHGTHLAGTAAGAALDGSSGAPDDGIAPGARLVIDDIQSNETEALDFLPADLAVDLFPHSYGLGARVYSMSWGTASTEYDSMAQDVDIFAAEHPDWLGIVAAGNDGPTLASTASPANAKNCLAIGSTQNVAEVFARAAQNPDKVLVSAVAAASDILGETAPFAKAQFGPAPSIPATEKAVSYVEGNRYGCKVFDKDELINKVALIYRSEILADPEDSCYFVDKTRHAKAAGAVAVLVVNRAEESSLIEMSAPSNDPGTNLSIPTVMVLRNFGDALKGAIATDTGGELRVTLPSARGLDLAPILAWFSARGPTRDLRFKPDLLAPGDPIISAKSDGMIFQNASSEMQTCAVFSSSGTSMSAPLVAGAAAIVRQYLREGWLPPGPRPTPSAAAIKAILLNGAVPIRPELWERRGGRVGPATFEAGFGEVSLAGSLPFVNSSNGSAFRMALFDEQSPLEEGTSFSVCVEVPVGVPAELRATLVWTDPPAARIATETLVNDLDLELRDESSGIHLGFGNGRQARDSSNGWHAVRDSANNVEKVVLDAAAPGRYALIIEARKVPEGTQAFALAISGNFTSAEACTGLLPSCGMGCGEQGECVSGRCSCPLSRRGERCELSNPSLELDAPEGPLEQELSANDWTFFVFPPPIGEYELAIKTLDTSADPDYYLRWNSFPSLSKFDLRHYEFGSTSSAVYRGDVLRMFQDGPDKDTGLWVLGVHAFCCKEAKFSVELRSAAVIKPVIAPSPSSPPPPDSAPAPPPSTLPSFDDVVDLTDSVQVSFTVALSLDLEAFLLVQADYLRAVATAADVALNRVFAEALEVNSEIRRADAASAVRVLLAVSVEVQTVVAATSGSVLSTVAGLERDLVQELTAGGFESPKVVGAIAFKDPSVDEASGNIDADWQEPPVEHNSFWDDMLGHAAIILPAIIGGLLVIYVLLRWWRRKLRSAVVTVAMTPIPFPTAPNIPHELQIEMYSVSQGTSRPSSGFESRAVSTRPSSGLDRTTQTASSRPSPSPDMHAEARGSLYANAQTRALYTNALNGDHPENLVSEPAERTEEMTGWVESPSMQVSVAGSTGVEAGAQHSGEPQAFIGAGGQRPEELQPLREPERRARSR